jgi:YD repeat-containing protein
MVSTRHLPGGDAPTDQTAFWEKLDWTRLAILMQVSTDHGRTWQFRGVVAHDARHRVTEFGEEDCFTEPSAVIYPDGEWVCVMRTGSWKPLYLVRSQDGGATWSEPVVLPIRGVCPKLVLLPDGLLALATGRPDCTLHFSSDRGHTWPVSEVLFTVGPSGPGHLKYQWHCDDTTYDASTCNVELALIDDRTLLYVHDALRHDPEGATGWLKYHGFGRMIGRFVTLKVRSGR